MLSTIKYRSEKQAFEITDKMSLSDKLTTAICGPDPGKQSSEDGASDQSTTTSAARNDCARTAFEKDGWTYAGDDDGSPTFTRSRQSSVTVPTIWPLTIKHSIDTPSDAVGSAQVLPDDDSIAIFIGPAHFISESSPPALSSHSLLDDNEAENEEVLIPMGSSRTLDNAMRLELASSVGRWPIVVPLLDFSGWGVARWIILLIATVFQEQVKDLIKWLFGAMARAVGLGERAAASEDAKQVAPAPAAVEARGGRHRKRSMSGGSATG
jgi:hypothetical protein